MAFFLTGHHGWAVHLSSMASGRYTAATSNMEMSTLWEYVVNFSLETTIWKSEKQGSFEMLYGKIGSFCFFFSPGKTWIGREDGKRR